MEEASAFASTAAALEFAITSGDLRPGWPQRRTLAADRAALWRAVAGWLGPGPDFHAAVTELALALLLDRQPHAQATLVERVGKAAAGEGWPDRATAQAPDLEAIWGRRYGLLRTLKVLGLVEESGDWQARTVTVTPVGQATALQALHARAPALAPTRAVESPPPGSQLVGPARPSTANTGPPTATWHGPAVTCSCDNGDPEPASMRRSPTGWHRGRRAGTPHPYPSSPAIVPSAPGQLPDAPLHPGHRLA